MAFADIVWKLHLCRIWGKLAPSAAVSEDGLVNQRPTSAFQRIMSALRPTAEMGAGLSALQLMSLSGHNGFPLLVVLTPTMPLSV